MINSGFATSNNNDHVLSFDGRMLGISHHAAEEDNGVNNLHHACGWDNCGWDNRCKGSADPMFRRTVITGVAVQRWITSDGSHQRGPLPPRLVS
ncbi:MAG: hypothetical protein R2756_09625 [Bacteroidales bacterium]